MRHVLITHNFDFAIFVTLVVGCSIAADVFWLRRQTEGHGIPRSAWAVLGLVIVGGCFCASLAGKFEQRRLKEMVAGIAPTYAYEMVNHGLEQVTLDTKPDDPTYLALIELEKRWLACNPGVADICTYTRNAQGQTVLLVDSETDYDRNGVYETEPEQRTPIGEPYIHTPQEIDRAFAGENVFLSEPSANRWGTWVSCFVPIRGHTGSVIGVLEVDFPAQRWIASIFFYRAAVLGLAAIAGMIILGTCSAFAIHRGDTARRARVESLLVASRRELAQLTDALHQRLAQKTSEIERLQTEAQQAAQRQNESVIAFCGRLREQIKDLAPARAPAVVEKILDEFEDTARLANRQLTVAVQPSPTLDVIAGALAAARGLLPGCPVGAEVRSPLPSQIVTDARRLSQAAARACELVAGSPGVCGIHVALGSADSRLWMDLSACECSQPAVPHVRTFADRKQQIVATADELGTPGKLLQHVIHELGGEISIVRQLDGTLAIHIAMPTGESAGMLPPDACAARLAA